MSFFADWTEIKPVTGGAQKKRQKWMMMMMMMTIISLKEYQIIGKILWHFCSMQNCEASRHNCC
jgi:hypothetical protein